MGAANEETAMPASQPASAIFGSAVETAPGWLLYWARPAAVHCSSRG